MPANYNSIAATDKSTIIKIIKTTYAYCQNEHYQIAAITSLGRRPIL